MALDAALGLTVAARYTSALDLGATNVASLNTAYRLTTADGALAGQANRVFYDQRTLTASSTEDLDLAGVLLDAFGVAITFARIKGLIVSAAAANINNVVVGAAASNGFISWVGSALHTVTLRPGATMALMAGQLDATGYAVTAATADLLRIGNGGAGTSVTYDIVLIGAAT